MIKALLQKISISVFITLLVSVSISAHAGQFKVVHVVDGDTIDIDYYGKTERIRLLCIDTPETVHPDKKQNIPMGLTASNYTKKRLAGKYVDIQFEGSQRDRYNRLLAYVMLDGKNINIELVEQGLSPYYTQYGLSRQYHEAFKAAERDARKQGLNIWGDPLLTEKYLRLKSKWGQKVSQIHENKKDDQVNKEPGIYIGNTRSKKFHRADCTWAAKISPGNTERFQKREEAVNNGYVPCKACKP